VHYHVGVRSAEKSIQITNALATMLPVFLALSTSSPFWHGDDTGLESARTKVFESLPSTGLPPNLADWAEFERFMTSLINAGAMTTIREVWWDIRPHPNFGTVELRMCDAMPTMTETCALAALAQCAVARYDELLDRGYRLPSERDWVLRENKWRAARHGLDASMVVDAAGRTRPITNLIEEAVEELMPFARARVLGASARCWTATVISGTWCARFAPSSRPIRRSPWTRHGRPASDHYPQHRHVPRA
jgi:glutamate---cysteine ligase / carboxylate-amine ligase